jgi:hypothetical protein
MIQMGVRNEDVTDLEKATSGKGIDFAQVKEQCSPFPG